jgi:ADP-heptose:LPS heptosyltransferase
VQRILVIKFLGMGSILLATPLLKRLAMAYPDARITFLTLESNAELVRRLDWVDDIVVVPRGRLLKLLLSVPGLLLNLRRQRFDLALDLEFYSRLSNLVSWGSRARRRVGFFVRARWRGSLLTESVYFNSRLPYADAVLALLRPLGLDTPEHPRPLAPHFDVDQEVAALGRLVTLGIPQEGTLVVVNVNASDLCVERRWPGDRFARLVERFSTEVSPVDRFVFIGAPSERSTVKAVLDQVATDILPSCLDLAGRTSLMELTVLLKRCALLITNDSGPLHLADSLGVPTISFFGPETPDLYGPQGDNHLVFYERHWCSPCLSVYNAKIAMCHGQNECMRRIDLEQVISSAAVFCRERVGLAPARIASKKARKR